MTKRLELPYRSIPDMFLHRVAETPDKRAFGKPADDDAGDPVWLTWREVDEQARAIAAGLTTLGVQPEDRVGILANTRLDWILADLGIMLAGAATTTVYPTTEPEDAVYIVADSGSKVLFAENAAQAAKLDGADLPDLAAIVLIDGVPGGTEKIRTLSLAQLEAAGRDALKADPELIERIVAGIQGDQLATLIYTSGTTGRPKGVELMHLGWVWQGYTQVDMGLLTADDLQYLWLPLSHSFGKTLLCGIVYVGLPTYVDGRVDKLIDNLGKIQPTIMCAAPRTQPMRRPPQYGLLMPPIVSTRALRSNAATDGGIASPSSARSTNDSSMIRSVPAACAAEGSRSRSAVCMRWPVGLWKSGMRNATRACAARTVDSSRSSSHPSGPIA